MNNLGEETLYVDGVGSHLYSQIHTFCPLPILHLDPYFTNSCATQMLRHVKDGIFPKGASMNSHFGKYFSLRTQNTKESCPI